MVGVGGNVSKRMGLRKEEFKVASENGGTQGGFFFAEYI